MLLVFYEGCVQYLNVASIYERFVLYFLNVASFYESFVLYLNVASFYERFV